MTNGLDFDILNKVQGLSGQKFNMEMPSLKNIAGDLNSPTDLELQNDLKVLTNESNNDSELNNNASGVSGVQGGSFSNILQGKIEANNAVPEISPCSNTINSISNGAHNYLNNVNALQNNSDKAIETFASGGNIDLHSVMVAAEKANVSMQLTMQLRNKILSAYQEISRMQA